MGCNFTGLVRLKVSGRRGKKITLRFAERLNTDGSFYTTNLREARVQREELEWAKQNIVLQARQEYPRWTWSGPSAPE